MVWSLDADREGDGEGREDAAEVGNILLERHASTGARCSSKSNGSLGNSGWGKGDHLQETARSRDHPTYVTSYS